jgi:uncharacterized protein YgiM (DUF1202 family)
MNKKLLKFSLVCATGVVVLAANSKTAWAYENAVAGLTNDKLQNYTNSDNNSISSFSLNNSEIPMPGFTNIAIADVETNLMIRSGPGEDKKILGKLPKNGGCDILEKDDGSGWTKVKSGKVTGYVKTDYLITGAEASALAKVVGNYVAKSNTDGLNVRKSPSVDSETLDQVAKGEELLVSDALVVSYGEEHNKWVEVLLDSDDSEEGIKGYVAKEFVDLSYQLKKAVSMEELELGTGVSSLRANLVSKAKQYLGNPYVYGGTSLTNGIDCSGFTQAIYAKFGYYIPRVSRDQARSGNTISKSNLRAGDLVFYGNSSSGYISHVAIYIGNGQVIHASNRRDDIKISSLNYRTPIKCVRYISD